MIPVKLSEDLPMIAFLTISFSFSSSEDFLAKIISNLGLGK